MLKAHVVVLALGPTTTTTATTTTTTTTNATGWWKWRVGGTIEEVEEDPWD